MSANALEILRLGGTWIPRNRRIDIEYNDALAAVEALLEAAKTVAIHGRHSRGCAIYEPPWLGRRTSDSPACTCGRDALAAAVRRVETGQ